MGAGNWLPGNRNGLLDWEGFYVDYEGIYGEKYFEEDSCDEGEIDDFIDYVVSEITQRFPDLCETNEYRDRDERVYLEDGPIKLVMGDNESSVAVYFILEDEFSEDEQEDREYYGEKFGNYADGLKEILIDGYTGFIYERTGAWTSGRIG